MKERDIRFQIVRIVAMALIIICHLCTYTTNSILTSLAAFFEAGGFIFLLISGFLYGNKKIENNKEWIKKRLGAILIPMYIFLLLLIWINITKDGTLNITKIIAYMFNVQYFYGGIQGGGHLWFVTVIMICYLILPLMNRYKEVIINKKNIVITLGVSVSAIIGLFSEKIGLLGFYILTVYIGYLISFYKTKVFDVSYIKTILFMIIAIIARITGKLTMDNTLFYETTVTGLTHILLSISIFIFIYKFVSKLKITNTRITNIINKLDLQSYNIFIVHYMYIVGPLEMLDITKFGIVNIGIYIMLCIISAKALSILSEYTRKIVITIKNIKLNKISMISLCQATEIFLIVLYKYLLAYNYRNYMILYMIALLSGIVCLIVCCLKIKEYKIKDILVMVLLGSFAVASIVTLKSINLVFPLMIAISFYNETPKKICKIFFWSLLICFIITIILNIVNVLEDHNLSRLINKRSWIRYSLGFMNPAFVLLYYTFIVLAGYCAYGYTKKYAAITNFGTIILYCLSLSRTGLICILALNLIVFLEAKFKFVVKIIKVSVPYIYALAVVVMILLTIASSHLELESLNYLLSGRIEFNQEFYDRGYFNTWFGVSEKLDIPLDNYYLYTLIKLGIVGCVVYCLLNAISLYKLGKNKEILIAQVIVFLYGIGETNVIVSSINFIMSIQVLALINRGNKYILGDSKKDEE